MRFALPMNNAPKPAGIDIMFIRIFVVGLMDKIVNKNIPISAERIHVSVLSCILNSIVLPMNTAGKVLDR